MFGEDETITTLTLSPKARTQMVLRALLAPILMVGLLFFAGRWDFWQAWVYSIIDMIFLVLMGTLLTRNAELAKGYEKDPSKLEENLRQVYGWRDEVNDLEKML